MKLPSLPEIRKAIVAIVGFAAMVLDAGLVPSNIAKWVAAGIAAATALGVYVTPNAPKP